MKDEKFEPFDLARAQAGEPIQTRDGFPVKFIVSVPEANEPVVVLSNGNLWTYPEDGESKYDKAADIVMVPKKMKKFERWMNIYKTQSGPLVYWGGDIHASREVAKDKGGGSSFAIAHVTWEEPE